MRIQTVSAHARTAGLGALLLLPGALTAFLSLHSGGYFSGTTALCAALVALALAARVAVAPRPAESVGLPLVFALLALAGLAAWTLASVGWSDAPGRARVEYDRVLLYTLTAALFGTVTFSARRLSWMVYGIAAAIVAVCALGLASLLLPDLVTAVPSPRPERLSHPLTYWNSLGVLAGIGIVLCGHLACADRHPAAARVLGAAAVPLLVATLLATYSRGATWATVAGVLIYCVLGRPRGLVSGALATAAPALAALATLNPTSRLTRDPGSVAAIDIGRELAVTIVLCMVAAAMIRLLLIPLDRRLAEIRLPFRTPRLAVAALVVVAAAGVGIAASATGAAGVIGEKYAEFTDEDADRPGTAGSSRLMSASANGRIEHWQVSLLGFRSDRLHGTGAGTYELLWERERPTAMPVVDGHSLYLEVLGELGLPGLILVVVALVLLLGGAVSRMRGPERPLMAAVFAAGLVWAIHAGVDWHWEVPAVTLWLFALGGAALARRERPRSATGEPPSSPVGRRLTGAALRMAAVAACAALAIGPARVAIAEARIVDAGDALYAGDCSTAVAHARTAIREAGAATGAQQIVAWCEIQAGRPLRAARAMRVARRDDPHNWENHYMLAMALAAGGRDGRDAAREAIRLNPREPLVRYPRGLLTAGPRRARELGSSAPLLLPSTTERSAPPR